MKRLVYPVLLLIAAVCGLLLTAVLAWDPDPRVGHGEGPLLPASALGLPEPDRVSPPTTFMNDLGMRFVYLQPGTFVMGSPADEPGRTADETRHTVTLTRGFYMQTTEVTNAQLRSLEADHSWRGPHDSGAFQGHSLNAHDQPAADVSWNTAREFSAWMSEKDPRYRYHLPTEAQWEYACRAGSTSRFSWGASESDGASHANANDLKTRETFHFSWAGWASDDGYRVSAPVGSYRANPWALHDMEGNVMEWCADWYGPYPTRAAADPLGPRQGLGRVLRGGSWLFDPQRVRCAQRLRDQPHATSLHVGFRLVAYPAR